MARYRFVGHHLTEFPTLHLALVPGDEVELPEDPRSPWLERVKEPKPRPPASEPEAAPSPAPEEVS